MSTADSTSRFAAPMQIQPMAALVSGPANAIQNSVFALVGSFSICDTPPSANSVISFTGSPCDRGEHRVRQLVHQQRDKEQQARRRSPSPE